jgi:hypothetical protein
MKRVTSLLTRSRDPSPLLRHPSVYSCCLATDEARRCATRHGTADLGSSRLARRKHRFVYCLVIVGACFDVTVLAWRKYATILSTHLSLCLPSDLLSSGFPPNILYVYLLSAIRATCPAHLILLDLISTNLLPF